jgi:hypothetical protein
VAGKSDFSSQNEDRVSAESGCWISEPQGDDPTAATRSLKVRGYTGKDVQGKSTQVSRVVYGSKKDAKLVAAELTATTPGQQTKHLDRSGPGARAVSPVPRA